MNRKVQRALSLLLTLAMLCGLLFTTAFAAEPDVEVSDDSSTAVVETVEEDVDDPAAGEPVDETAAAEAMLATLTEGETWSGSGTQADPYLIEDADDLLALSNSINSSTTDRYKYFKLESDIEVSNWEPIGYSSSYYFAGDFDGNGHSITINGISSTKQQYNTYKYYGLFGYTYAKIHDLTVAGTIDTSSVTSTVYAGGIAGYAYGSTTYKVVIVNCVSEMNITTYTTNGIAGGILGYSMSSTFDYVYNCYSTASVSGKYAGGIVGQINGGNFTQCVTTATNWAGYGSQWATTSNCYDATTPATSVTQADLDSWNSSVSAYTSVTDFWSLGSDGPEHTTCVHQHAADDLGTVTAPTCTEQGYTTYTCTICHKAYKADFVDALGHILTTQVTEATCTEPGSITETCTREGCGYTNTTEIPALGHNYVNGYCTRCNAKEPSVRTVTIGTGTSSSNLYPYDNYYKYSLNESIYTAEEIGTAGVIEEIAFQVATASSFTPTAVKIYMGHTSKSVFASSSDWMAADDLTLVYEGTPTLGTQTGWETVTLDTAFSYNGTDNLVIAVSKAASSYSSSLKYCYTASSGNVALYRHNDSTTSYANYDNASTVGTLTSTRANVQLTLNVCAHENKSNVQHQDATCTTDGYDSFHCEDCGQDIYTVIPATGHTWVDVENDTAYVAPTCGVAGQKTQECSVCHETQITVIPATGDHNFVNGVCTVCGALQAWDGTTTTQPVLQDGVYLISSGAELAWFAGQVNSSSSNAGLNAKLTADINLGDHAWTPIGSSSTYFYSGTFDGGNHAITGLNVAGSSTQKITGLFGYVKAGTIKNLAVYGTVAGYTTTGSYSGGFVGQSTGITMDNCANYAAVSGYYAGGLVGDVSSSRTAVSITNSYNAGTVTGNSQAGGFFGELGGSTAVSGDKIENGFTYGAVSVTTSSQTYLGTIWGWANSSAAPTPASFYYLNTQTYASSYTKGTGKNAEEFKTLAASLGSAFVDSEELGHPVLTWEAASGGEEHEHVYVYVDQGDGTHIGTCEADGATITEPHVLDANGECVKCGYKEAGSVSNPIQISTAAQLQDLADAVNGGDSKAGVYYVLTQDITLPGSFTPIGAVVVVSQTDSDGNIIKEYYENSFAGHFDGDGHTVTLNITDRTGSDARVGLFGSVAGTADDPAVIENVTVTGSVQSYGGSCIAGLVGYAVNAEITNCGNGAAVTNFAGEGYYSSNGAAGILGRSGGNVTITGSFNVGAITAGGYAAGIVYDAKGSTAITDCYDVGALTATDDGGYTGGIVAVPTVGVDISLTNCYAAGTYTATKPGAVVGTVSQAMTMSSVYYQGSRWLGSDSDYGWSDTHSAPAVFTSYSDLVSSLGNAFKSGTDYALLSWQTAALTPGTLHIHSYTSEVTDPTCTEQGYTTYTCDDCGYTYKGSYVEALGHVRPADSTGYTHNDNDTHSFTCTRCNTVITEDCTYDDGVVTTLPTKDEDGVMTYTCTVCGGTKTEAIPATGFEVDANGDYLIQSDADLALLATKVNAGVDYTGVTFKLTANVSATASIGTITHPFTGSFDGGYHTVTITVNDNTKDFNGLFGAISGATVEKVIVKGTVTGGSFTAGVAGYANNSTIRYCGNEAAITGGNNHTFGQNAGPNDCYAGGIVGYATGDTVVVSCYNRGAVYNASTGDTSQPNYSKYTGGIVGQLYEGSVIFCYNTGNISISTASGTSYTYTGGIAGMAWSTRILNSYSTGTVTGGNYTGGVLGSGNLYYQQGSKSYYLAGSASAGAGTGADSSEYIQSASADALKSVSSTVAQNLSANFVSDANNVNGGYLILNWQADPDAEVILGNTISTAAELRMFANLVNAGFTYEGQTVQLLNDIDLEGSYDSTTGSATEYWTAIGDVTGGMIRRGFYGTFDGQNHEISNLVLVNSSSGYQGMFAVLPEGATVKNLTVSGTAALSQSSVGSIVGWNLGTVENCTSNVNISASACNYVGGIVADNAGTVKNCVNNGTVNGGSASSYVGGVVGHCEPAYDTSYNAVTTPSVEGCVNKGSVTGYEYVGGVVGAEFNDDGACASITGSANHGSVTSSGYAGGVVGYMSASSTNYDPIYVTNCYNTGNVYGTSDVGGIVGHAGLGELTIKNCFSTGTVSGLSTAYVGEIAGYTKADIYNSYYVLDIDEKQISVASGSGDNYAQPVLYNYLFTEGFEDLIKYEFDTSVLGTANANETADFYAYDIYSINVLQPTASPAAQSDEEDETDSNSDILVVINRLDNANSYSVTGFKASINGVETYYAITDAEENYEKNTGWPRLDKDADLVKDSYGSITQAVFHFGSSIATAWSANQITVLEAPKAIAFSLTVVNDLGNGRDESLAYNLGSFELTSEKFTVTTATNYDNAYQYTVNKSVDPNDPDDPWDSNQKEYDGVAVEYVTLADLLSGLGFTVIRDDANLITGFTYAGISATGMAFTPIDAVLPEHTRDLSFGSGLNINQAILAIRLHQSNELYENDLFEAADRLNAVRLITQTPYTTPTGSDISDSVKWISEVAISFGNALRLGDVNLDGVINMNDYMAITAYMEGNYSFSALQVFLADINGDGVVNSDDTDFFV